MSDQPPVPPILAETGAAPPGSAHRRMALSVVDQGLSSGSNFVLVFLLARSSSPSELGLILIGYTILTLSVTLGRNTFGAVLGMDLPRATPDEARLLLRRTTASVLATSLLTATALAGFALLLSSPRAAVTVVVLAVASPILLLQDIQRYWAVAVGHPGHAVAADAVWFAVAFAGFVLPLALGTGTSAAVGAATWAAGALLSSLVLAFLGYLARPLWSGLGGWLVADVRRGQLSADALLACVVPLVNGAAVAAVGGPQLIAAIRGAATLFGPLNLLSATIPLALVPEAIRATRARAQRLFTLTTWTYGVLSVTLALVLHLLPNSTGSALLGETWPLVQAIVLITGLEYVGLGIWSVARARLRVQDRLAAALRLRVVFSVVSIVLPVVVVLVLPTAAAVAASLAVGSLVMSLVAYRSSRRGQS